MVFITPGIDFLGRGAIFLSIPTAIVVGLNKYVGLDLPLWILITGTLLCFPARATIRIVANQIFKRREAARLGVRIVPVAQGKWIGNFDVLRTMNEKFEFGYPGDGLDELIEQKGLLVNLRVLWSDMILTTSPEHIKTVLATDFHNYVKGERFHYNMGAVLGTGVFNSDGEMWKFHRAMTRPVFTRDKISHFDLFDKHVEQAIFKIKLRFHEGYAVDFQDLMSRFTLDSATEFLFGNCVHSLSSSIPYPHTSYLSHAKPVLSDAADAFASAFLAAQVVISTRERLGWIWPLFEIWQDKSKAPMKIVNAFIEPIVREAIEKRRNTLASGDVKLEDEKGETLLDHLVSLTSDPVVLKDETLNIMIAGRDTTAATLTFIIYCLSEHPTVLARLRSEILAKVGASRRPDYDDIREMKYLRAVINETLRLFPIVPFNVRESIDATTWPSTDPNEKPFYIPAGTKILYSVFMMHRRQDLWGPDAEQFDPDRFLDARVNKYLIKNSFIFLPFNAGPRICLGQQFAYNEMSFMLIRLLQSFQSISLDLASAPQDTLPPKTWINSKGRKATEKVFPKMHLTMYANGGLWVKMQEATGEQ